MNNARFKGVLADWGPEGAKSVVQPGSREVFAASECPVLGPDEGGFCALVKASDPATYAAIPDQFKVEVAERIVPLSKPAAAAVVVVRRCLDCGTVFPVATGDLFHRPRCRGCKVAAQGKGKGKGKGKSVEQAARERAELEAELLALRAVKV